jgi:hypothetical protein
MFVWLCLMAISKVWGPTIPLRRGAQQSRMNSPIHVVRHARRSPQVAIKIARNNDVMAASAEREVRFLKQIMQSDAHNKSRCEALSGRPFCDRNCFLLFR